MRSSPSYSRYDMREYERMASLVQKAILSYDAAYPLLTKRPFEVTSKIKLKIEMVRVGKSSRHKKVK